MDNPHVKQTYDRAYQYLSDLKISPDVNILEYVCRYHHCVDHEYKNNPIHLYEYLKTILNIKRVNAIWQLINAFEKKKPTYPALTPYLEALNYAHEPF